jgi:hypothetical protein
LTTHKWCCCEAGLERESKRNAKTRKAAKESRTAEKVEREPREQNGRDFGLGKCVTKQHKKGIGGVRRVKAAIGRRTRCVDEEPAIKKVAPSSRPQAQ